MLPCRLSLSEARYEQRAFVWAAQSSNQIAARTARIMSLMNNNNNNNNKQPSKPSKLAAEQHWSSNSKLNQFFQYVRHRLTRRWPTASRQIGPIEQQSADAGRRKKQSAINQVSFCPSILLIPSTWCDFINPRPNIQVLATGGVGGCGCGVALLRRPNWRLPKLTRTLKNNNCLESRGFGRFDWWRE